MTLRNILNIENKINKIYENTKSELASEIKKFRNIMYSKEHIKLCPLETTDITDKYQNWLHDSEITRYNSHGIFPQSKEQIKKYIENQKNSIIFAILYNNIHIGNTSLQEIDWINRSAEFAILIGEKNYWGKGIASTVLEYMLIHAFLKLGLNRVWAGTVAPNIGMQKVFEKTGFEKEGILKEEVFLDGKFVDVYRYGIIKSKWG